MQSEVAPAMFSANGAQFLEADDMIVRWCRKTGNPFEPDTTAFIFGVLAEQGGRFIDVGASTGWFSIPVALRGFKVTALEPNYAVFRRFCDNVALNPPAAELIDAQRVAASNRNDYAVFYRNPDVPLTSGGSIQRPTCRAPETETVSTVALDSLHLSGEAVRLIKIDVEGHEPSVLAGAKRLISEQRPFLVLEANTPKEARVLELWCQSNGYEWEAADGRNMLCRPLPW